MPGQSLLLIAALCSVAVALLHVYVIVQGPEAYRQFGAGEQLASMAERGSWLPAVLTSGITLTFLVFAAYALSAARWLPPLPFARPGLLLVAGLYTLRGVALLPVMVLARRATTPFEKGSSLLSLGIGLVHGAGIWAHDPTPLRGLFGG